MMRPMKYLSADLLQKVFHGLICIMYHWYSDNSHEQPKQAILFSPVITS